MSIFRVIGLWLRKIELKLKADIRYLETTSGAAYADLKAEIKKL